MHVRRPFIQFAESPCANCPLVTMKPWPLFVEFHLLNTIFNLWSPECMKMVTKSFWRMRMKVCPNDLIFGQFVVLIRFTADEELVFLISEELDFRT